LEKEKLIKTHIHIWDFIDINALLSSDFAQILFESEISVARANAGAKLTQRWAQISKIGFQYFKNRYTSSKWLIKPLLLSTWITIERIETIDNKKPLLEYSKVPKGSYCFVIIFKTSNNIILQKNLQSSQSIIICINGYI